MNIIHANPITGECARLTGREIYRLGAVFSAELCFTPEAREANQYLGALLVESEVGDYDSHEPYIDIAFRRIWSS